MRITICDDKHDLGTQAAKLGAKLIKEAILEKGKAVIVLPTGLSQIDMYDVLTKESIPWDKVEAFHLDEYVGLSASNPSSFRYYLQKRFVSKIKGLGAFHEIEADAKDLLGEVKRLNDLLSDKVVDVIFLGIGENGHIAFNDPPANLETTNPFIIVNLEERCRRQQVSEKWFASLDEVPTQAISISIRQILKAKSLICSVPDQRKARAVAMCLYDQLSPYSPCTVLRDKEECTLLLDKPSSMLILGDRR
ncbi:6-phosphogluconolactonase [uncultured Sphaerochaeta sp.]|uniref:6-phosphogluconolactonase n=1 Tax=uncultured Sphaerochaeta sp. TaxID=886478 RepID=UPI002A0A3BBE|nr:6-phosphogluconolactonase [uncultured Sphaerochaeta sp.]